MISFRTRNLFWGALLLPLSIAIAIRTFRLNLWGPPPTEKDMFVHYLGAVLFIVGTACALFFPFSYICDRSTRKKNLG